MKPLNICSLKEICNLFNLLVILLFSQVLNWSLRLEKELSVLRSSLEEEQKKQITLIKQVLITIHFLFFFLKPLSRCIYWDFFFSLAVMLESLTV